MSVASPGPDRRARRREQTRAKLVTAARSLFARQGVERTRINEITEEADVGFGSFYNHFDSKDAIVETVLAETLAAHAAALSAVTDELDDPAEVISAAHRYFVGLARTDPEWAWLLLRLDLSHTVVTETLGPFARRDLRRGIEAGRLGVPDEEIALEASGGALLSVIRTVLAGSAPRAADVYHAEGILRLLGLPAAEAAEVARRPLPAAIRQRAA